MLFISYRRTQRARVEPLVAKLEHNGVECFLDVQDIDPLGDFPERIRLGIDRSHALLAWWSLDYGDSDFCLQEFRRGWQHARRHSSDLARRIWVVNPEGSAHHIFAGELNSQNFLQPPAPGREAEWANLLRQKIQELLPEGPLADERQNEPAPVFYNAPMKSSAFTGRARDLMTIHSKLHPVRLGASGIAVALQTHGMGGIGKTELASAYAYDFAMAYPGGVYWLNLAGWKPETSAREDDARSNWLLALQQVFGLDTDRTYDLTRDADAKALSPSAVRNRLAAMLGTDSAYLWVLDNLPELSPLDSRARILEFIRAPTSSGRTLLTTRDGRVADGFIDQPLDVLGEEDALRLLARVRPQEVHSELAAMRELVRQVGAHTQALFLLSEHARDYPGGYPRVLQRLIETGRLERIEQIAHLLRPLVGDKARGIVSTFDLTIESSGEVERGILLLASVCAPNLPIPDELLTDAFAGGAQEDEIGVALGRLLRAWLLSRREGNARGVFIHPLVAAAAIHLLKADALQLRRRLVDSLLERIDCVGDIRAHGAIVDDVQQARALGQMLEEERGVNLLLAAATFEQTRGAYTEAVSMNRIALELARRVLPGEHPLKLGAMNNLGSTLFAVGDLSGARLLQDEVFTLASVALGAEHPNTCVSMINLADTLRSQGHLSEARELEQRALSIYRRVLPEGHPKTLGAMNTLATTMSAQGDFTGARALQEEAFAVASETLGEDDPIALLAMNNLATRMTDQGEFKSATRLQERALLIRRRVQGAEHPETITAIANLANGLSMQGDLAGARALQEEVLATARKSLGDEHAITLAAMNNLANTLRDQGDFTRAKMLLEQALSIRSRTRGRKNQETLLSMTNLAYTLVAQGNVIGARELQEEALAAARTTLGDEHPITLGAMAALANTMTKQRNVEGALVLQKQSLSMRRRLLGDEHPDVLFSMISLAETLRAQGDLAAARLLHDEALSKCRRVLGDEHPATLTSMHNLANTMIAHGDLGSARQMQEQVLSVRSRVLGIRHPDTTDSAWAFYHTLRTLRENVAAQATMSSHLLWLLDQDPATLGAVQNEIRDLVKQDTRQ
jgi:tetratricopeptide (TPR) repeat protein